MCGRIGRIQPQICGRKLGRGLHQFAQFELALAAGQQNAVVSEVALVKFGNATASLLAEACGAVVTLSFCASFGWRRKLNKRVISRVAMRRKPPIEQRKDS